MKFIYGILGICASGMFVVHGKLFLASTKSGFPYLVSFDPDKQSWMVEHDGENEKKNASCLSLRECPDSGLFWISIPYFSVILQDPSQDPTQDSSLGKHHVAFSSSVHDTFMGAWDGLKFLFVKLTASLLNENGGVILYQHLDQCFEGIQPHLHVHQINLVDLGQGKLCAVLYGGFALENDYSPVLCISIFTPSLIKDFAALQTDSTLMEEQTFLSVTVHSKSLYSVKDWYGDYMKHAFVWPPPKEGNFHSRTTLE